ncbi:hypothetical protein MRX96_029383 [Rhipicephalus microplus]
MGHALTGSFPLLFRNMVDLRSVAQLTRNSLAYTESVLQQTMYAFFLLNGVVDVLYNAGLPLPPNTDYVVLLIATASEGLLFHFYLQGKPLLDVMIHTLLVYTIAALVACLIAEMCRPRSILASLAVAWAVNEMCGSFCEDLAIADAERVGNFCEAFITRDM